MINKGIFSEGFSLLAVVQYFTLVVLVVLLGANGTMCQDSTMTIEGRVILERDSQSAVQTVVGGYQNKPQGSSFNKKRAASDGIVMWLETKSSEVSSTTHRSDRLPILDQVDKQFKPRLMAIRAGDTVRIHNSDPVYHNVFSLSKTKRFDVGRRAPGDNRNVVFDKAGKVDVFCDIHSDMHAVIMVVPRRTVAIKKILGSGAFQFTNIPQGTDYVLHLYALGDRSKQLKIPSSATKKVTLGKIRLGS